MCTRVSVCVCVFMRARVCVTEGERECVFVYMHVCVCTYASFFSGVYSWLVMNFNYLILWVRVKGQG